MVTPPISEARCPWHVPGSDGATTLAAARQLLRPTRVWRKPSPADIFRNMSDLPHDPTNVPDKSEQAAGLLSQLSTQMVRAMKQYYGKGPVSAKSYLIDDLLFIVMREE
jgi:hypothetical protein